MTQDSDAKQYILQTATESLDARAKFVADYKDQLVDAARMLGECIQAGGKVLICGNGGSAGDSQHMATEMVGRMLVERRPLPAIALTTDTSLLTAIANDFGYELVFSKQIEALGKKGDVLIAISTSGKSANVLKAVSAAKARGLKVITLTGGEGGPLKQAGDIALNVAAGQNSSRIQETHLFAIHSMVDLLDRFYLDK